MEAKSAAAEVLRKTDAGGDNERYRHGELGREAVEEEEVKPRRVADAPLPERKRKRAADPEDDGSVSDSGSGSEGPPQQQVKPCLSPVPPLQRLLSACRALLTGSSSPPTPSAVALIRGIMDKIGPDDVGLRDEIRFFNKMNAAGLQNPPIVTCKPIYEGANFSIAVFFLPLGAVMPLHDHPGMTVFTKVLIGSARLEAYDWVRPRVLAGCCSGSRRRTLAKKVRDDHGVTAAASAWVLFPNSGGNMHRFAAAEDAHCAFLDVLTPPYAPTDRRRCTFYQDLPYEHHRPRPCTCRSTATGGAICDDDVLVAEEQTCRLAWLEEVPQPRNLRVVCLPFRGPTIF
ncbi:Plant cysteine oxidase 2 [Zea mays]|uniref:cysteine dioxygenase n=2 Tax=Zea mays TaxID=4577 RepID=A0A317YEB9_MAIZE|nr:hypothetical protein Zm00014a_027151 [Zea mays]PWZ57038.1 hypothetical protein Zm00014a_027151 [Zea mays]PWZ57039.1 Plant cysteine oxidase 2 [Zea mays]